MSTNIGIRSVQTLRRPESFLLLALIALIAAASLIATPALAQDQPVFNADFGAQSVGVPLSNPFAATGTPDVDGDFIVLVRAEQNGNTIRVQAAPGGGFPTNSLRIRHPQGFGSNPSAEFHPPSPPSPLAPYNSGFFTVTWRSSVEQPSLFSLVALVSPAGASAFTVNHTLNAGGNPRIAFQSGTGVTVTAIPYVVNVPQTFRAVVRMAKKTFDLYVDETRVACGQPFQHQTFDAISHLVASVQAPPAAPNAEVLALDDVRILRSGATNTPPVLTAIPPQTVDEGELLQFTVSAVDCDGDALTFDTVNLPLGATFQDNGNNGTGTFTGTFTWVPDSAQGGGQYYVTVLVSDGSATTSAEVTITVNDEVDDADGDGVPDAAHAVLGGPDNCQFDANPGQFDVNRNGIGDACDNANQNQATATARTDKSIYVVGEPVTAIVTVTFNISGTECVLIRTVDPTSVHFEGLAGTSGPVPADQVVHPGGAVGVSAFQEACPGTPVSFSTNILVNGPEAPHLTLPVDRYTGRFLYNSLGARDPDVDFEGNCTVAPTPEDPTPCQTVFQVKTTEALAQFTVIDPTSALAEADTLCSFIQSLVTDPNTKKDLLGKCRAIRDKIARGSLGAACNDCNSFISAVQNYLAKKKLTQADASFMLGKAARIKQLIGCA